MKRAARVGLTIIFLAATSPFAHGTTKGLSQIVTPDLQGPGDLSLSFQAQSERIANPYELQAEMGLTNWASQPLHALNRQSRLQFIQIFDHSLHSAYDKRKPIVIEFVWCVVR
jgi:hypothetical protein